MHLYQGGRSNDGQLGLKSLQLALGPMQFDPSLNWEVCLWWAEGGRA